MIRHTYRQWFVAIAVNLSALTYGIQSGWVSPSIKTLQSDHSPTGHPLTDIELSWVGSTQSLAAIAGVPLFSFLADKYGRKISLFVLATSQTIGWLITISSATTWTIIAARVFCGFATGGCFVVVPMYIKEISQDDIRGILGSLLNTFQHTGLLLIYAIGAYLDYFKVLWVVLWLPVIQILVMIKIPESPAFLIKTGKVHQAAALVAFLRNLDINDETVKKEIDFMQKEQLHFKSLPNLSCISVLKEKVWRNCFFKMMMLFTIHAGNGTSAISTYASTIISYSSNSSVMNAELQSFSFPITMMLTALVSMSCVERYGRKPLLTISLIFSIFSILCLATVILMSKNGYTIASWIPLMAMIICEAAFSFGLSGVPFIMLSEMFSFQIRAKAIGLIITYALFCNFVQIFIFNPLSDVIGLDGAFYFYAGINFIGLLIVVVLVPETKGKTFEQIQNKILVTDTSI